MCVTNIFVQLQVSEWYKVVIFTASTPEYADPVIDWLDKSRTLISKRYFRDVSFLGLVLSQKVSLHSYLDVTHCIVETVMHTKRRLLYERFVYCGA
jgi:TFIIF-interacting CTD phosphatase-like protein